MSATAEQAWTVLALLNWTAGHLAKKGVPNPRREADALLGKVLDLDRLQLYLAFETLPSPAELGSFRELVRRRGEREPLQHLLGEVTFDGLRLRCDRRALIPRPETEGLAQKAAALPLPDGGVADLGTGSGCLALSLHRRLARPVLATDISAEALELARENAQALGSADGLRFEQGALFEPFSRVRLAPLALLVSNPPYVPEAGRADLQPEVGRFDPSQALFAGEDGLAVLRPLLAGAPAWLAPGAWLALECGEGQASRLKSEQGPAWAESVVEKDLFGVERYLFCRRA